MKRATKARGFQLDRPLYIYLGGGGVTKLPLKPFKGAKLVLTSVMPCRWKRVPFVINEVTNHFIKRLFTHTHTHLGELIPLNPPFTPSSPFPLLDLTTNAGLLQQSMVILLRLTQLWCPSKSREITSRIKVVPSFLLSASLEEEKEEEKYSSSFLQRSCFTGLPPVNHPNLVQTSGN